MHQDVLFYEFRCKHSAGISGKNREMQLPGRRGRCQPGAKSVLAAQIQWRGGTWEPLPAVLLCPLCTVNPLLRLNKSTKNQKLQTNCCLSTVKISRSELSARWENGEQPAPLGAIKVFSALQTLQDLGTVSNKCRSSIFSVSCREGEVEGHSLKPQKLGRQ